MIPSKSNLCSHSDNVLRAVSRTQFPRGITRCVSSASGTNCSGLIQRSVHIPVVAIGGINASNIAELSGSGVDGVAVVSAIFAADDPGAATAQLLDAARKMVQHG